VGHRARLIAADPTLEPVAEVADSVKAARSREWLALKATLAPGGAP
jgi:hypothetical protein